MNDREKWRERVRDIRASGMTWWWWWWYIRLSSKECKLQSISPVKQLFSRSNNSFRDKHIYVQTNKLYIYIYIYIYILAGIPVDEWVQKEPSKSVLKVILVTASILFNVLHYHASFYRQDSAKKIIIESKCNNNILLNSKLVYPNKNIVNNHVDYKSISILVTQKKGMPVLCKRGASFKPDINFLVFISIFWFNNWSSHHIDCGFCM